MKKLLALLVIGLIGVGCSPQGNTPGGKTVKDTKRTTKEETSSSGRRKESTERGSGKEGAGEGTSERGGMSGERETGREGGMTGERATGRTGGAGSERSTEERTPSTSTKTKGVTEKSTGREP